MSRFIYFTSKTNLAVIKTLHHRASYASAKLYDHFFIKIILAMTVTITYHHPRYISVLEPETLVKNSAYPFFNRYPLNFTAINFRSMNRHHQQIFC